MAGKSKGTKKKRAKMRKRIVEEQRHNDKKVAKKIVATQAGDEANNNLEPTPPKVNEDAQKDEAMVAAFDPKSVVANILKKKDGA